MRRVVASSSALLAAVAGTLCLLRQAAPALAQLEPQYLAPQPPDTVTCYDAGSLVWRSIPGKMVVTGTGPKPKPKPVPKPPVQAAPPAAQPGLDEDAPLEEAVAVGAHGGVAKRPPVPVAVAPVDKQQQEAAAVDAEAMAGEDKARAHAAAPAAPPAPVLPAQVHIKALNWFGLDRINIFEGTNYKTIDEVIEFFLEHKFNAIRLPFSLEFALSPMDEDDIHALGELQYPDREKISPEYYGLNSWEIVDLLFEKCAEKGILILLDMHTLDPDKGISRLWYDPEKYSEATVLWGWERIVLRYANHWNLFGLDVMNECHDHASWGKGDPLTDFNRYVERFILFINERVPQYKGLFFVEGIFLNGYGKEPSPYPYWWGGNLFGAEKFPIDVKNPELNDRIVYAPHIYGPDVSDMGYFHSWNFPYNLNDVWDDQYGWLIKTLRKAVVVGEWGGSCNGKDGQVQEKLAEWMANNCIDSNFWWALNPGSQDTDGLMSPDWNHYDERKMKILDSVQPNPSSFTYDKETNTVCVRHGESKNPECRYDPANLPKNRGWNFFDEATLSKAMDSSYQSLEKRLRGNAAANMAGQ